jgi:predicted alpha/beta-hydrolase family hydrolase
VGPHAGPGAGEHVVPTARGPAGLRVLLPEGGARALVALGHGAGGRVDAPDLVAVATALSGAGVGVGLVTQPYRVAGRRAPAPAAALDDAWLEVVAALRGLAGAATVPVVCGGRSSGARVACRTAAATGAAGVLALAFPLRPPPRRTGEGPAGVVRPSRAPELVAAARAAPVLVVQGTADPFGAPADVTAAVRAAGLHPVAPPPASAGELSVHEVAGADHVLRAGRPRRVPGEVATASVAAVLAWVGARGIGPGGRGVSGSAQGPHPED